MAKGHKTPQAAAGMPPLPADCREAIKWFVENFGLYQGSVRGMFLSDFTDEHEAALEKSIITLRSRGFNPLVVTGETLFKQAEYLFEHSCARSSFGKPIASKLELDISGSDMVILKDLNAPENERQLWYFYNHLVYPRALTGKALMVTTPLAYEEFVRYGAACPDVDFSERTITWEKLLWLLEATTINLELFRLMREEGLPPMLKAEYYLWMALKERGLSTIPQHVLGDYMLDLALIDKEQKLDIEVDGLASVGGHERQAEEAKRNLVLLADGWQILRFTTAEILNNHTGCAEAIEDLWKTGRKKLPLGRWLTGQTVAEIPELPVNDEYQMSAITHGGGPAAVVGGAGTGKTTCIINRLAYLISQGVSPESILVISHSPDCLKAIQPYLEQVVGKQACQRLNLWSWEDLGLKILKENISAIKRKPPLKVETNPQKIIQRILAKHKRELDPITTELSTALDEFTCAAAISIYKANLVSAREVKEKARDVVEELVAKVYQSYEEHLQRANRIDGDDMVALAVSILLERPEVRARYQGHFDFVLVDEYQDATIAEDALVRLLAAPQDNLYRVGDEDEAIYESRGAQPRLLAEISHRAPQTRCYVLEKNWRSHPAIVDHARQLLAGLTRRRIAKEMVAAWETPATTAIIGPHRAADEKAEAEWVADEIQILIDSGRSVRDIAVLYRYHRYAGMIEDSLSARGVRCLASHPEAGLVPDEVEDMMAYLRLVMDPDGPKAKEAFERVCQLRSREVDPKLSATIAGFAEANNLSYLKAVEIYSEATADQSCRELEQLVRIIRTMHQENLPPAETISLIKRTQRLSEYYRCVHVPPGVNYEPLRKLNLLEEEARKFKTVLEFVKHQQWLRQHQGSGQADGAGVSVLSLYEVKGLEFSVVFMVGVAQGLFPADNAADPDEERRLCYVGFTRARELLYLSYPACFGNVSLQPSAFLVDARLLPYPLPSAAAYNLKASSPAPPRTPYHLEQNAQPAAAGDVPEVSLAPGPAKPAHPAAAVSKAPAAPPPAPLPAGTAQAVPPMPQQGPVAPVTPPPASPYPQAAPQTAAASPVPAKSVPSQPARGPAEFRAAEALAPYTPARPGDRPQLAAQYPPARGSGAGKELPAGQPIEPATPSDAVLAADQAATSEPILAVPGVMIGEGGAPPAVMERSSGTPPDDVSAPASAPPLCPSCTYPLEAHARFCGECGHRLGTRIPACTLCGAPLEPSAKFCGECGTRLRPAHFDQPLSPGGLPHAGAYGKRDQHGWLVKLLKFLEPG